MNPKACLDEAETTSKFLKSLYSLKGSRLPALSKNKDYTSYLCFIQLVSGEFNIVSLF